MLQSVISGLVDCSFEPLQAVLFSGSGLVNKLAYANVFNVIAAVAINGGIPTGSIVHSLFTFTDCTQAEVLMQKTIAAFLAVKYQILDGLFRSVK